jgi:hypothetical protein
MLKQLELFSKHDEWNESEPGGCQNGEDFHES